MVIGSGVDVIEIPRIERVLAERGDRCADELAAQVGGTAWAHLAVGRSRTHAIASVLLEVRAR